MLVFSIPFATLFPLISLIAIGMLIRTLRTTTKQLGVDANEAEIKSDARQGMFLSWGFATFWSLLAFPLAFLFIPQLFDRFWMLLLVALFPLVGVVLIWVAASRTIRLLRNGAVTIALNPSQPHLAAVMAVRGIFDRAPPSGEYRITLLCEKVNTLGESTTHEMIWQQERAVQNVGTHLACKFLPPGNLPTSQPASSVYNRWRVLLRFPDGKDERGFDISMAAAAEGAVIEGPASASIETATSAVPARAIPDSVATVVDEFSRLKIDYHPNNSLGGAFGATLFGLVFAGVGGFLMFGTSDHGAMPFMMGLVFCAAGIGIVVAVVYALTNRRTVEVSQNRLRVASRWLLGSRHEEVAVSQIEKLVSRVSGTGSVSNKRYAHQHIRAVLSNDREIVVSGDIRDAGVVKSLLQLFQRHLGLAESAILSLASENARRAKLLAGSSGDDPHEARTRNRALLVAKIIAILMTTAFAWDFIRGFLAGK